jgi:site-specific recombinase XerC
MANESWIRAINNHLKRTNNELQTDLNITSHRFRIGFVTRIIMSSTIEHAREIVGHKHIQTTQLYNRYTLG